MSNQPTLTRREQERARKRRKREWVTETPLDVRAFYRDTLGICGEDVIGLYTQNTNFVYRNKGEVFVHAGEPVTTVRFVISGVSRGYVLDDEGGDNVICFGSEYGQPLLGASTLSSRTILFVEAVTDMELLEVPVVVIQQGIRMNVQNTAVYERLIMEDFDRQTKVQVALNTLSGYARYEWFLKEYADIAEIVPQNYVASFLGIQPQSLSRIKRQHREKETKTNE